MRLLMLGSFIAFGAMLGDLGAAQNKSTHQKVRQTEIMQEIFDPANITTFEGVVTEVSTVDKPNRQGKGVHFTLKTDDNSYEVVTGPEFYIDEIGLELQNNKPIVVEGFLVEQNGSRYVIPSKITMNGKQYILRNNQGVPAWSGRGRN